MGLFCQISYVGRIGEKITEREYIRREQKDGRGNRASGAAYATQSEGTYAKNVKTSKKVAKYFLEPSRRKRDNFVGNYNSLQKYRYFIFPQ